MKLRFDSYVNITIFARPLKFYLGLFSSYEMNRVPLGMFGLKILKW